MNGNTPNNGMPKQITRREALKRIAKGMAGIAAAATGLGAQIIDRGANNNSVKYNVYYGDYSNWYVNYLADGYYSYGSYWSYANYANYFSYWNIYSSYGNYSSYASYNSYGSYGSYGSYNSYSSNYSSYGSYASYNSYGNYASYSSAMPAPRYHSFAREFYRS